MKTTIYWNTCNNRIIDRIRLRFRIAEGITLNGETVVDMDENQIAELREYEKQGFIILRNK